MQYPPELPNGVTWDDVDLIPDPQDDSDKNGIEAETVIVAKNRKTGEIYR